MINKKKSGIWSKRLVLVFLIIMFILLGLLLNNKYTILVNNSFNKLMEKIQFSFFVDISKIISLLFEEYGIILITFISFIYLFLSKRKKEAVVFSIVSVLNFASVTILKNIYSISRPVNALIHETDFSFPSGHSSIAVVLFGFLAYIYLENSKKNKNIVILASAFGALAVAFSRLYLNVHWLSDVIGGIIIGSILFLAGLWILEKW